MIERTVIDGRDALVQYMSEMYVPSSKEDANLARVVFEDNDDVVLLTLTKKPKVLKDNPFQR